jgi:KDO2-lipid IV(A) lauroyltransferase
MRTLRAGGIVALVADRHIQGHGICTTLQGRRVRLPAGPFELAYRTGAIVLPVLTSRGSGDRLTLFVEEPFSLQFDNRREAVEKAVQRWAGILERHIERDPGQWTVTEDFWKVHACG